MRSAREQAASTSAESVGRSAPNDELDPGLVCLVGIAHFQCVAASPEQLRHQLGLGGSGSRFSETDLLVAAKSLGLKARCVDLRSERLGKTPLPALFLDRSLQHFVVARVSEDGTALIQEGSGAVPAVIPQSEVMRRSGGRALLFASRASVAGELMNFDFSWFIPAVVRYRRFLLEVLGISAALQILGLVSPLMFQVVMDKVLINQAFNTLRVVTAGCSRRNGVCACIS